MNEDKCVCCGETVTEGRQVCWSCEHTTYEEHKSVQQEKIKKKGFHNWIKGRFERRK